MRLSIDNRLYMDCPEGFHELTEEEKQGMNLTPGGKVICISDPVRHIVITAGWTKVNELTAWLVGTRELAWNMSRQIEKNMKKFSYVWLDNVKRTIDGQAARGHDYEYVVKDINMTGESLVVKIDENLFYFHMYARKARRDDSLKVFHDILDNVAIAE
ncbi:MAG: hypothetical protein IJH43_00520 [Mogibacterium sp.]|nr:hypothetical protein [Mogibacterium sp.]